MDLIRAIQLPTTEPRRVPNSGASCAVRGFLDYVMRHGGDALEALRRAVDDPEHRKLIERWIDDDLL